MTLETYIYVLALRHDPLQSPFEHSLALCSAAGGNFLVVGSGVPSVPQLQTGEGALGGKLLFPDFQGRPKSTEAVRKEMHINCASLTLLADMDIVSSLHPSFRNEPHSVFQLSLQTKLLLDLVADAQSYHLEEQRYTFNTSNISKAYPQPQLQFLRKKRAPQCHSQSPVPADERPVVSATSTDKTGLLALLPELKGETGWWSNDPGPLCMLSGTRTHSQPILSGTKSSVTLPFFNLPCQGHQH
ncbi:hypothetical protein ACRRTK_014494 [Alexandromys fortis]